MSTTNFIFNISSNSDGVASKRPKKENEMTDAEDYFLKEFGKRWALHKKLPMPQKYTIDQLPAGYAAYLKYRPNGKDKDRWVWGHPKGKFNTLPDFFDHFLFLQGESKPCKCTKCSKTDKKRDKSAAVEESEDEAANNTVDEPTNSETTDDEMTDDEMTNDEMINNETTNNETTNNETPNNEAATDDDAANDAANNSDTMDVDVDEYQDTVAPPSPSAPGQAPAKKKKKPVVVFESDYNQQVRRAKGVQDIGYYCHKAQIFLKNGDKASHAACMSAVDLAFWRGLGYVAWHLIPVTLRIRLLDEAKAHLRQEDNTLDETLRTEIRALVEWAIKQEDLIDNYPLYLENDEETSPPAEGTPSPAQDASPLIDKYLTMRSQLRDYVIREFGFKSMQPLADIERLRSEITRLLASDAPLHLKFEVISLYVGNIPDMGPIEFDKEDEILSKFVKLLKKHF